MLLPSGVPSVKSLWHLVMIAFQLLHYIDRLCKPYRIDRQMYAAGMGRLPS